MDKKVLALDLSLASTGVAYEGGVSTIKTKLKDEARLVFITETIKTLDRDHSPYLVVIEGLAFASQTGKAAERGGLHYMVRTEFWVTGTPFAIVPPTSLKKYVTGKGNSAKDEVLIAAVQLFPDAGISNNNEADAMGLYAMGMDYLEQPIVNLPALNRSSLSKIEWPGGL